MVVLKSTSTCAMCFAGFGMMEEVGFNIWTLYLSCLVVIAHVFLLSLGDEAMLGVGLCLPGRDLVRSCEEWSVLRRLRALTYKVRELE